MGVDQNINFYIKGGKLDINQLFKDYSKPLFYFALKFVEEEQAKDIVQDVFYKLWEDKSISVTSSLNGLLFTMVKNKCLQHIEKLKVRENYKHQASTQLKEEEINFYTNEATSLLEQELQDKLEVAISNLPDKCRQVFELSRFQGKMNKEIANELDISIKTVEKHISKALSLIRSELKDYLPLFLFLQLNLFQEKNSTFFIS